MSFILDALKKLEQKRQQNSVPDIMTVHTPTLQEQKKYAPWLYVLIIVLLLNTVILIVLLRPHKLEKQKIISQTTIEQQNDLTPVRASHKPDEKGIVKKLKTTIEKSSHKSDKPPLPENKIVPLGLNPTAEELEILRNKIKEEQTPKDSISTLKLLSIEDVKTDSQYKVPALSQLPSSIRKELPDLSIKGHIYSDNPSSRIVNINGSIIREGETIAAGLKVDEITRNGVIFIYHGMRFHIRAF